MWKVIKIEKLSIKKRWTKKIAEETFKFKKMAVKMIIWKKFMDLWKVVKIEKICVFDEMVGNSWTFQKLRKTQLFLFFKIVKKKHQIYFFNSIDLGLELILEYEYIITILRVIIIVTLSFYNFIINK